MKKQLIILILISLFTTISSYAGSVSGHLSCGRLATACDKSKLNIDCQAQTAFAQGYISALSWEGNVDLTAIVFNADNVKYALIRYCKANPFSDTHEAAEDIFNQIK